MKLWLIKQVENLGYDTYDSAVVAAGDDQSAKEIHPSGHEGSWGKSYDSWCKSPAAVSAEYIGEAKDGTKEGAIICASFNAG